MKINRKIKVVIVDDSGIFRRVLFNQLKDHPHIEVVGMAKDPYEARDVIVEFNPDVLILDIMMPGLDGIEFLNILKNKRFIPTIAISGSSINESNAIAAGAVDFIEKPTAKTMRNFNETLVQKIINASGFYDDSCSNTELKKTNIIVITQHMPPIFTKKYAQRLDKECSIKVVEGKHGDVVLTGHAYIAPGGYQMGIVRENNKYILDIKKAEKVSGHCPSVDYLFESVAIHAKNNSIATILTGMGNDGAKGLLSIKNAGGYTIGQNKETCVVYGMPMAAKNIGAVLKEVPLEAIPNLIVDKFRTI